MDEDKGFEESLESGKEAEEELEEEVEGIFFRFSISLSQFGGGRGGGAEITAELEEEVEVVRTERGRWMGVG